MQVEPNRVVHMVRSVVLLGEYHMRLKAYENQLDHAILIPTPPPRESAHAQIHDLPAHPRPAPTRSQIAGDASCGELDKNYLLLDDPQSSAGAAAHKRSVDGRSAEVPEGWLSHLGQLYSPSPSAMSSASGDDASRASSSVDGMVSRSSTASRDSICPVVKETFGELVDKLRTLEGRQATFSAWPHVSNPRLSAASMAKAGFLFAPDAQASDKVLCAYCGLELAHWEEDDDPHTAHHDSSPVRFLPMTVRCLRLLPRVYYVFVNSIFGTIKRRGGIRSHDEGGARCGLCRGALSGESQAHQHNGSAANCFRATARPTIPCSALPVRVSTVFPPRHDSLRVHYALQPRVALFHSRPQEQIASQFKVGERIDSGASACSCCRQAGGAGGVSPADMEDGVLVST